MINLFGGLDDLTEELNEELNKFYVGLKKQKPQFLEMQEKETK